MSDSENVYRRQRVGLIFGVNFGQKKLSSEKCEEEDQIEIVKVLSKQSWNFFADFDGKKWKWNEVTNCKNPIFIILSLILNIYCLRNSFQQKSLIPVLPKLQFLKSFFFFENIKGLQDQGKESYQFAFLQSRKTVFRRTIHLQVESTNCRTIYKIIARNEYCFYNVN